MSLLTETTSFFVIHLTYFDKDNERLAAGTGLKKITAIHFASCFCFVTFNSKECIPFVVHSWQMGSQKIFFSLISDLNSK